MINVVKRHQQCRCWLSFIVPGKFRECAGRGSNVEARASCSSHNARAQFLRVVRTESSGLLRLTMQPPDNVQRIFRHFSARTADPPATVIRRDERVSLDVLEAQQQRPDAANVHGCFERTHNHTGTRSLTFSMNEPSLGVVQLAPSKTTARFVPLSESKTRFLR